MGKHKAAKAEKVKRSSDGESLKPAKKKQKPAPAPAPEEEVEELEDSDPDAFPEADDDDDAESIDDGEQQVDFDFMDPSESDFHVIKAMMHPYLDGTDFDSSLFADTVIEKAQVGTVLRTGEDCVGLATVLPLHFFDKLACVKQIARHWLSKADEGTKKSLKAALSDAQTGIIISERVVNAPPQLGAPLMAGLAQELALCKQRKDDAELQVYGKLKQFLVCAKVYEDKGVSANQSGAVPLLRNSQMATADAKGKEGETVFLRPEDECFFKCCSWSCSWAVPALGEYEKDVKYKRILMMVTKPAFLKSLKEVAALFDHDLSQHGL